MSIVVNGVPFAYRLEARRDLRELAGASGGYLRDKPPGAATGTPGIFIRLRVASVTVDSVQFFPDPGWTYFFSGTTWHDEFSDGTEADGGQMVLGWPGHDPVQHRPAPRYEAVTSFSECHAWDIQFGGPMLHQRRPPCSRRA